MKRIFYVLSKVAAPLCDGQYSSALENYHVTIVGPVVVVNTPVGLYNAFKSKIVEDQRWITLRTEACTDRQLFWIVSEELKSGISVIKNAL